MILGVSKYGVKVASLDQCVSVHQSFDVQRCCLRSAPPMTENLYPAVYCSVDQRFWVCLFEQDVLHRHPLYLIVRMLCYDDGLGAGKNLLALKTTDAKQEECSIWVYQCSSSVSFTT